jgi:hypothetical protein
VWDSGIGIAEASLPRIWDEFFQAQSNRPLEAHHRKGLGLGLAIVKRLAGLMDAPIGVRSRVGHGTVFSMQVPVGKAPRSITLPSGSGAKAPLGLTLEDRFILVVEDEAAVREGLVVLLQAWGARVVSFDTVEAVGKLGHITRGEKRLTCCWWTTACRWAAPASTRWWRCARTLAGRRCCRRSSSPAAAWAATKTRP